MFHMEPISCMLACMSEQVLDLLDRLVAGSVAVTSRAITAAGVELTFAQWRVLVIVGEHETGQTVHEIAARLNAHASPTSRLVGRLRRKALVTSAKEDPDGRVTRVRLTETGRDLRGRVLEERRRHLTRVLERASLGDLDSDAVARLAISIEAYA
jgi:DNA-binding MarR family transcriptional regulator